MAVAFGDISRVASGVVVLSVTSPAFTPAGSDRCTVAAGMLVDTLGSQLTELYVDGPTNGTSIYSLSGINTYSVSMSYWLGLTGSDRTITVSGDTTAAYLYVVVAHYVGVHQTTPTGTAVTNNGTTNNPSFVPNSNSDDLCVGSVGYFDGAEELTGGSGVTVRDLILANPNSSLAIGDKPGETSSTTVGFDDTALSPTWKGGAVALKPAVGGSPPTVYAQVSALTSGIRWR